MLKYEANPDEYSSHEQILRILYKLPKGNCILDVGTARGFLGQRLVGNGYYMVGIERDHGSGKIACKYYDEFLIADVESTPFCFTRKFDAIVLADILEHVREPLDVVIQLRPWMRDRGKIIISVPNVANIYVRFSLLLGKFDYTERGILDETHVRFFTWESINTLLRKASLSVIEFSVTPIPLPMIIQATGEGKPLHLIHKMNWFMARMWKTLFAYQFIIVATVGDGENVEG